MLTVFPASVSRSSHISNPVDWFKSRAEAVGAALEDFVLSRGEPSKCSQVGAMRLMYQRAYACLARAVRSRGRIPAEASCPLPG